MAEENTKSNGQSVEGTSNSQSLDLAIENHPSEMENGIKYAKNSKVIL